jgi:hypothetical protein
VSVPINPGPDGVSRRVFSLIFNGLTRALPREHFMLLSERHKVSEVIYEELRLGGIEIRAVDGLAALARVSDAIQAAKSPPTDATPQSWRP